MIMAKSVYNNFTGLSANPAAIRNRFMIPLLPRILIHAKLRMTEFVIIGKMETARRIPRHFLLHRLIKYAVGTPAAIHAAVVITATFTVLANIFR